MAKAKQACQDLDLDGLVVRRTVHIRLILLYSRTLCFTYSQHIIPQLPLIEHPFPLGYQNLRAQVLSGGELIHSREVQYLVLK